MYHLETSGKKWYFDVLWNTNVIRIYRRSYTHSISISHPQGFQTMEEDQRNQTALYTTSEILTKMPTGLICNYLNRAKINQIHLTNQNNCTKLETALNLSFRKILNSGIDNLNFNLKIVETKLQQLASIIKNTSENIYEINFKLERNR